VGVSNCSVADVLFLARFDFSPGKIKVRKIYGHWTLSTAVERAGNDYPEIRQFAAGVRVILLFVGGW